MNTVTLAGKAVPAIGQGTWRMGEAPSQRGAEIAALRLGIEAGLSLIDTAEMYGEGGAEQVVGEAIAGLRDQVYLVSKVYPHHASRQGVVEACERSLQRLHTDHLDLYLLHWPGSHPLEDTIEGFERLREQGKIGQWGVSNFDVAEMAELPAQGCATNQVLYNPETRGVEFDLLPWCRQRAIAVMAYCPIGQGGRFLEHPLLNSLAAKHHVSPAEVSLAWVIRDGNTVAIPKAVDPVHVRLNARAGQLALDADDLAALDASFAPPSRKQRLRMV
ncbi:aldo/keto reductase [Pseudomonas typographi]|uniref:Aldo/keto reductase n=1 Tax=Pseudomonas typographi TaxID=2715964 RepID=A0ABR7Z0L3_9PSED|nr:aldo/keto reductase [Pseudomonas typographi]MBD1551286.1 aldo/keto reductase [Pseudomonas typographi]MBD1588833.1 aldo/keto reductase [Pseudomonas typographi]MBD1598949.1 aldo/keto reductase [Pseudomonas typographi]